MKATILDYGTLGPGLDTSGLAALVDELTIYEFTEPGEVAERISDVDIIYTNKIMLGEAEFAAAKSLKLIALTATGTDNVDLAAANAASVVVTNIRAYCTESVSEHVFALLLSLLREIPRYSELVRTGGWQASGSFCPLDWPVRGLSGKTMGIVGSGELGQGVGRIAKAFGMEVIVSQRPGSDDCPDDRLPLDEVLAQSDVISLHCPLNDATRNLFGKAQFALMKPGAVFINTARGGIVDSAALADALQSGHLGGAGIDVLPEEPPFSGDPLLDYDGANLLLTPHTAWAGNEARQAAVDEIAENTRAFLAGRERNRVS